MNRRWICIPLLFSLAACISLVNYVGKGWEAYQKGDLDGAEKYFRTAVRKRPHDAIAHNNLGVVLLDLDRVDEAIQVLKMATILSKTPYASPHVNLAKAYLEKGDLKLAREHGDKAISIDAANPIAQLVVANVYVALNERLKEAESYAQTATQKVSDYDKAAAWSTLAEIEFKLGKDSAALQALDTALALDTDNPFYRQQKSLYRP